MALKLGTRGSPLALAQAHEVRDKLQTAHPALAANDAIEIVVLSTQGDRIQDRPLSEVGGKGLFTKELEQALLDGRVDVAVHSLKDVGVDMPPALGLAAFLPREDVRDVLITREGLTLDQLPVGARLGTASLRRQALLKAIRPDLHVTLFRGSVQTRLDKLNQGQADATLLALAGLKRLGMEADVPHQVLDPQVVLPAMAQGAIAMQIRLEDKETAGYLQALNHPATEQQVRAERACMAALDGNCRTPMAGLAQHQADGSLLLKAFAGAPDGSAGYWAEEAGRADQPDALGARVAQALIAKAGQEFFDHLQRFPDTWRG